MNDVLVAAIVGTLKRYTTTIGPGGKCGQPPDFKVAESGRRPSGAAS